MKSILFSGPPRSAAKTAQYALLAVGAAALLGLAACGQRGPLVLPPKPQLVAPKSAAQAAAQPVAPPAAAPASAPAAADTTKPSRPAAAQPSPTPPSVPPSSVTPNQEPRP